jgi:hypothetical protein
MKIYLKVSQLQYETKHEEPIARRCHSVTRSNLAWLMGSQGVAPPSATPPESSANRSTRPPGGESFVEQIARVRGGIEALPAGDVIIVAHAGTIRAALAWRSNCRRSVPCASRSIRCPRRGLIVSTTLGAWSW